MSKFLAIVLIVVGCILLTVANLSLWITRDVLDSERFGALVVEGLQSDEATKGLSILIMDNVLENRPNVPGFVRQPAEEFVSKLLQQPILGSVLEKVAADADALIMSGAGDAISLDLEKVVPFVVSLVTTIDPELAAEFEDAPAAEPIKLLASGELPKLIQVVKILPWLWPLAGLGALALFGLVYWRAQIRRDALLYIGLGVTITSFIGLLLISAMRLTVENDIASPPVRLIVGEVMTVFTRELTVQTVLLLVIGVVVTIASHYMATDENAVEAVASVEVANEAVAGVEDTGEDPEEMTDQELEKAMDDPKIEKQHRDDSDQEVVEEAPAKAGQDTDELSYVDELEKLAKLKDEGVITEDDYNAKKKQLLGL